MTRRSRQKGAVPADSERDEATERPQPRDTELLARAASARAALHEAIGALRSVGFIVQKVADPEGCYRVDNGPPQTTG